MSSKVTLEQLVGRLRGGENKEALFVDITDIAFQKSKNQYKARKKILDSLLAKSISVKNLTNEDWIWGQL
jgi:predicted AAA+ superfamily ATPase